MTDKPQKRAGWTIGHSRDSWMIARTADASAEDVRRSDPRAVTDRDWDSWLADPATYGTLVDICRAVSHRAISFSKLETGKEGKAIRSEIEKALARRELILINPRREWRRSAASAPEQPAPKPPPRRARAAGGGVAQSSWIEIVLKDRRGNPLANERFKIVLPDGTLFEGALDQNGKARKDGIEAGNCTVSFPQLGCRRASG
ncbi:MAG: hypothetical protein ABIG68_06310 [Acidobacteriota bacterium]